MATFGHLFSHFIGIPVNKDLNYWLMRTRWRLFQKRVVCTKFDIHVFAQLVLEKPRYKAEFKSMQAYTLVFNTYIVLWFLFCFSSSCCQFLWIVQFIFDCPFSILYRLLTAIVLDIAHQYFQTCWHEERWYRKSFLS